MISLTSEQAYEQLRDFPCRKITIPFSLLRKAGGIEMAGFIAQIAWLSANASNNDHFFFLSQEGCGKVEKNSSIYAEMGSWDALLGISKKRQEALRCEMTARGWLCHLPSFSGSRRGDAAIGNPETAFIFTQRRGAPPRLHYFVDPVRYLGFLSMSASGKSGKGSFEEDKKPRLNEPSNRLRKRVEGAFIYKRGKQENKQKKENNNYLRKADGTSDLYHRKPEDSAPGIKTTHLAKQEEVPLDTKFLQPFLSADELKVVVEKVRMLSEPQRRLDFLAQKYECPNEKWRPQIPLHFVAIETIDFSAAIAWRAKKEEEARREMLLTVRKSEQELAGRNAKALAAAKCAAFTTIVDGGPESRRKLIDFSISKNLARFSEAELREKCEQFALKGDETIFGKVTLAALYDAAMKMESSLSIPTEKSN